MEDVFIDLGNDFQLGNGDNFTIGEDNLLSESETLVGPQGPPGPPGRDGVDGQDGQAATITVGTTTTTAPGTDAIVTNVGDDQDAILNFSIPRGAQGERGETGETGPAGADGFSPVVQVSETPTGYSLIITDAEGTTGANLYNGVDGQDGADGQAATITVGSTTTGNAGTNASVTNSGTTSAAVLDFVIPRGADGAPGQDGSDGAPGADGQAATVTVGSTTTGNPGTSASVTNSGTTSAAVLNFTIPRGDKGEDATDYSQSEQVIGTWINGKPLYRKTVSCGTLPNNTVKNVAHGISNLNIVTKVFGTTKNTGGITFPLPFPSTAGLSAQIYFYVDGTNIVIGTGTDRSAFTTTYITLEYTKTTD